MMTLGHIGPPVATILLSLVLLVWLRVSRWETRGVRAFIVMIVIGGILWQVLTIAHVLSTDLQLQGALTVGEKWVGMCATLSLSVFVSKYTTEGFHRRRWVQAVAVGWIGGYALLAVTNPVHHLILERTVVISDPFLYTNFVRGPMYFVFLAINYIFVSYALYVLIKFLYTAARSSIIRIGLIVLGATSVSVSNLMSVASLGPVPGFNYASIGVLPLLFFSTVAVFWLGLFDIAPIVRNALVESLSDAVIVVDKHGRVADYNRQATTLWPNIDQRVGDRLDEACPEIAGDLSLSRAGPTSKQVSFTRDGEAKYYSLRLSRVERGVSDDALGYAILLRDVTDLEISRQQLKRHNEKLDLVASTIAHDLRNPITVANGNLDIATDMLDTDNPESIDIDQMGQHLETTSHAHERMEQIIDEVLTLVTEGQTVEQTTSIALPEVAREAWETVDTGEATLTVDADAQIQAEKSRLLTIFENLFRNAVEHASCGPDETKANTSVEVGTTSGGFYVADDGPGIPDDEVDAVFESGYTTEETGTGLGLSIVETMAESHGWSVDIDIAYTDGARFVFDTRAETAT